MKTNGSNISGSAAANMVIFCQRVCCSQQKGGADNIPDIEYFSHFPLYLLDKLMIESFPFFRTHSCGTETPISKVRLQIFQHIRKSENLIPPKLVKIVKPQTGETSESCE